VQIYPFLFLISALIACKSKDAADEAEGPTHSSCEAMDDAGIVSRLDGIVSSNRDIIDLNGHCFVNSDNNALGEVMAMRFIPYTGDDSAPIMHLQMYWIPPTHSQDYTATEPEQLNKPECYDVAEGLFCGHLDDNTNDDPGDDVDLRAKNGSIAIDKVTAIQEEEGSYSAAGDISVVLYAVDISVTPQQYSTPSLKLEGRLRWNPYADFAEDE
jgi:hypothetical protein